MLRVVYAGSPDVSAVPLERLAEAAQKHGTFQIAGVLTNPPAPQGRGRTLVPTPVALSAETLSGRYGGRIPVLTPERLGSAAREAVAELKADLLVCFAYGRIFGPKFMALFPLGGINLHPSLLPEYRGCAPVPAAILAMERRTGVSVQKIAQKMDSGDIISQVELPLDGRETAGTLLARAAETGAEQLVQAVLKAAETGRLPDGFPQDEARASYSSMLRKEDGLIDWSMSARQIDAQIRAFSPWPGAFTVANAMTLKLHEARADASPAGKDAGPGTVLGTDKAKGILVQTGDGVLCVRRLQWQAKKAVGWSEFINGSRNFLGTVLGK